MPSPRHLHWCVSLTGTLAVITIPLLTGCDAHRPVAETAPVSSVEVDATRDAASIDLSESVDLTTGTTLGSPLAGLTGSELARFHAGLEEFSEEETPEDGLGPVFNEASCVACHSAPVGGTTGRLETRFGRWDRQGFDALEKLGGSLMQDHAIGLSATEHGSYTYVPEVVPRSANVTAGRLTTPLFGLGLVEAVPDAALLELARSQARSTPSTAGTAHLVKDAHTGVTRIGRFGWKSQVATLHTFAGDAYLNEMGITSPDFPIESYPQGNEKTLAYNPMPELNDDGEGVELFADFMRLLAPPPRGPRTVVTENGSQVFRRIGCANCHTPSLTTGSSEVAAISRRTFQPYSDFLLHDMGSLGDGIVQGQASGRQMRTAPLWGLTSRPSYLHDGRARTAEAAILGHAGQGSESKSRYTRLEWRDRYALLAFLKSL